MLSVDGQSVPLKLTDQGDRTYRVEFEPSTVGLYQTSVWFAGQLTPSSPYTVNVQAAVDASKVRVTDMPQGEVYKYSFSFTENNEINQVQQFLQSFCCPLY